MMSDIWLQEYEDAGADFELGRSTEGEFRNRLADLGMKDEDIDEQVEEAKENLTLLVREVENG